MTKLMLHYLIQFYSSEKLHIITRAYVHVRGLDCSRDVYRVLVPKHMQKLGWVDKQQGSLHEKWTELFRIPPRDFAHHKTFLNSCQIFWKLPLVRHDVFSRCDISVNFVLACQITSASFGIRISKRQRSLTSTKTVSCDPRVVVSWTAAAPCDWVCLFPLFVSINILWINFSLRQISSSW